MAFRVGQDSMGEVKVQGDANGVPPTGGRP